MKLLTVTVATAALMTLPMSAQAQLFGGLDNSTLLGGAVGAGLGGAIGSNLAGAGVRDEGTAIGAVLGGLAGASFGNRNSRYGGNPYAGSFNPGFSGNNLLGAGIGAGLGGAIGSNLAGSGNRQEGTAIGAVLGGLAGYGIANARSNRYGNQGFANQGFAGQGFAGQGFAGQGFAPAYGGPAYGGPVYGGGFAPAPVFNGPAFGAPALPSYPVMSGPSAIPTGQYLSNTYVSGVTMPAPTYTAPIYTAPTYQAPAPQRQYIMVPDVTVAAPNVRLAGPSLAPQPDVYVGMTRRETMPIVRAERVYINSPMSVTMNQPSYSAPRQSAPVTLPTTYAIGGNSGGHTQISNRYASQPSGHHGDAIHITSPSTGGGHYHGNYTAPTLCYKGSSKRYTTQGAEIIPNRCGH